LTVKKPTPVEAAFAKELKMFEREKNRRELYQRRAHRAGLPAVVDETMFEECFRLRLLFCLEYLSPLSD
jgi:hypothetical protein